MRTRRPLSRLAASELGNSGRGRVEVQVQVQVGRALRDGPTGWTWVMLSDHCDEVRVEDNAAAGGLAARCR